MTGTGKGTQKGPASNVEPIWFDHCRHIVKAEIIAIESRRAAARAEAIESVGPAIDANSISDGKLLDVVGLSLSGGGIRSAAVGLGVLQALHQNRIMPRIDYLSTVSGGGYIGSSLSAAMAAKGATFPFAAPPAAAANGPPANEISDTAAVGHLRNYSNYLVPNGLRDLVTAIAIIVRGLVANLSLTLPVVLFLAAFTIMSTPARSCLYAANIFGIDVSTARTFGFGQFAFAGVAIGIAAFFTIWLVNQFALRRSGSNSRTIASYCAAIIVGVGCICEAARFADLQHFALTVTACVLGSVLFFAWAIWRSGLVPEKLPEFQGHLPTLAATYLVLTAVIAFFEFQPFMLGAMFEAAESGSASGTFAGAVTGWIKTLAAAAAPVAGLVTLFRQQIANWLKGDLSSSRRARLVAMFAKVTIWIAGLALPLLIWVSYLYLSYWGVLNDRVTGQLTCPRAQIPWSTAATLNSPSAMPAPVAGTFKINDATKTLSVDLLPGPASSTAASSPTIISHAPVWLLNAGVAVTYLAPSGVVDRIKRASITQPHWRIVGLYLALACLLFMLCWPLTPNANSLHRLYRDRLSKAFLFVVPPAGRGPSSAATAASAIDQGDPSVDQGRDFIDNDRLRFTELYSQGCAVFGIPATPLRSPYHLINAALNIQGSDYANRRGRNADFFLFSPLYIGSEATDYCRTELFEAAVPEMDVATAMAISGAAASSNMGSASIQVLTPTLALLNIRLGYWLRNPRYVAQCRVSRNFGHIQHVRRSDPSPLYLWSEITGRLYENSPEVYLTDGGHIENLGIYELLRRRCRVIIAVDAEADAAMNFTSLMTLQRYARIDLGVRINLPWQTIRATTLDWMAFNASPRPEPPKTVPMPAFGPHVAIGTIDYGGDQKGYLVYIKSSLSGDENDYVRDYARRNPNFPHETTGDQFFTEEQFEVYRALGFHMVQGWLKPGDDNDVVSVIKTGSAHDFCDMRRFDVGGNDIVDQIRTALGLAHIEPPKSKRSAPSC